MGEKWREGGKENEKGKRKRRRNAFFDIARISKGVLEGKETLGNVSKEREARKHSTHRKKKGDRRKGRKEKGREGPRKERKAKTNEKRKGER